MKVGIYISGLGQSVTNESAEKYTERLKNELMVNTQGKEFEVKMEKIKYFKGQDELGNREIRDTRKDYESTIYSIWDKTIPDNPVYKIYDFKYHEILTAKFNSYSLIMKNLWLFLLVARKFPFILTRFFVRSSYKRRLQTAYVFMIFLIISLSVLVMLPATLEVVTGFLKKPENLKTITEFKEKMGIGDIPFISLNFFTKLSLAIVPITALLLLIVPNANNLLSNLATEFVCANDYLQYGAQKPLILGNLELLVDYISEHEKDCRIHLHAYSFGSILALDYVYPYGGNPTRNAERFCEAVITIGTPFEFVKSYYPKFYKNRYMELGDNLQWLNVYSIADALGTNFRKDAKIGDAQFGIEAKSLKPVNLNYEVSARNPNSITAFISLYSIKVHGMYWDKKIEGKSCLGPIYSEMYKRSLIEVS